MELSIFLGVCWDYKDWVEVDKREGMSREKRLELNEWEEDFLREFEGIMIEVVKEVGEDIRVLKR